MDEIVPLRVRIQRLIGSGDLPCEDCAVTWYGEGRGRRCAACDRQIPSRDTEIECEVPGGGAIHFHLACYDVWQTVLMGKD